MPLAPCALAVSMASIASFATTLTLAVLAVVASCTWPVTAGVPAPEIAPVRRVVAPAPSTRLSEAFCKVTVLSITTVPV